MPTADIPKWAAQGRFTVPHNEILGTAKMTIEEMIQSSKLMASRLNTSTGPVAVLVPSQGFHHYDRTDKMYDNPEGRKAFTDIMQSHLKPNIELHILDCHINDAEFTEKVMEIALRLFNGISRDSMTKIVNLSSMRAQSDRPQEASGLPGVSYKVRQSWRSTKTVYTVDSHGSTIPR
jgi:hypothetical protein